MIAIVIIFVMLLVFMILTFFSNSLYTRVFHKNTEKLYEECIDHIDDIEYMRTDCIVHYFKYKRYQIILWLSGYATIHYETKSRFVTLEADEEIKYKLGSLLKQKIK